MRILVTGANGFIGRQIVAALLTHGHKVVAAVRSIDELRHRFPDVELIYADLNRDIAPGDWLPRLRDCDAVINCAGLLQDSGPDRLDAVHVNAPGALFDAAVAAGIGRIVQISAISAEPAAETGYAETKHAGDSYLQSLDVDWVILRPSLVYGTQSYGGTSLMRALAALPGFVPLIDSGQQMFQPIHVEDLVRCILICLDEPALARNVVEPVGPDELSFRDVIVRFRRWLGLPPARFLTIPGLLVRGAARLGDLLSVGPLNSTSLRQLEYGNTGSAGKFIETIGFRPMSMDEALARYPSYAQELWFSRLYFLRPLAWAVLGLFWILSGIIGFLSSDALASEIASRLGLSSGFGAALATGACMLDILIGVLILGRRLRRWIGPVQLAVIIAYTAILTMVMPVLWLDPLGPLVKNIPIALLVLFVMAVDQDR